MFSRDFDYDSLDLKMMNNRRDIYRCDSNFLYYSPWKEGPVNSICDHVITDQEPGNVEEELEGKQGQREKRQRHRGRLRRRGDRCHKDLFIWMTGFSSGDRGQLWGDQPQAGRRLEKRRYIRGFVIITIKFLIIIVDLSKTIFHSAFVLWIPI